MTSERAIKRLKREIENLKGMVDRISPSDDSIPNLANIDIYGGSMQYNGHLGGDHMIFLDFNKNVGLEKLIENAEKEPKGEEKVRKLASLQRKGAVLLTDISGHQATDTYMAAMLHSAFVVGIGYELERHAEVTTDLFRRINDLFYSTISREGVSGTKYATMIYGEITERGKFRYISAGHPHPIAFSSEFNMLMPIEVPLKVTHSVGMFPSKEYAESMGIDSKTPYMSEHEVNELKLLMPNDVLIIGSDGLFEHENQGNLYHPRHLQKVLRHSKDLPAKGIYNAIIGSVKSFGKPNDDVSCIVIKKKE